ncbi:CGNR zinc finger domain-containing protein [Streptosporangiaceae bacterium NEAU-GS5]|nr:CGNR zinc finger domain-containing protein [Streptosporangiaceae bacterium NEAU-GS5]
MTGPADLIRDFVNTYDVDSETDELSSPSELTVWMTERGLIPATDRAVDRDLAVAVHLREGLRTALRLNHDSPGDPVPDELDAALAALPLRVTIDGGEPGLAPTVPGVPGGLARIAALIPAAHADGTWPRLKVCVESTCQWAFLDSSKNRSRSWCSMRVCGNRTKTRAYRARRRAEGSTGSS